MTYQGTIKNGKVEIPPEGHLPDGAIVRIELIPPSDDPACGVADEAVSTGVTDLADQHNHYLYGIAKHEG